MKARAATRRDFVKTAGLGAAALCGAPGRLFAARQAAKGRPRPNILFIMTDQQFADALSCAMGREHINTPNIDGIAADGVRFTRAYCSNPLCVPSRASIFTGRYPHEHGRQTNRMSPKLDPEEFPNVGMLMGRAGYATGYCGKWHLPYPAKTKNASDRGFDFAAHLSGRGNDPKIAAPAVRFIQENRAKPFLLVCSFMNPHNICEYGRSQPLPDGDVGEPPPVEACPPAPANLEKANHQSDALEAVWQARLRAVWKGDQNIFAPLDKWTADDWRRYRWAYYRMVELVDREVGKILAALRQTGLEENTVILFTSDHGDGIGSHRWAQKNMFYDECARIPMIISQKGTTKTGTSDDLVNNGIDLLPTICDYAGVAPAEGCRGRSLREVAEGKTPAERRSYVACSTRFVQDLREDGQPINLEGRMIRTDRYKYYVFNQGNQPEMLIDMKADPGEMTNLVGDPNHEDALLAHRRILAQYKQQTGDPFLEENKLSMATHP